MKYITKTLLIFSVFLCGRSFGQTTVLTKDEAIKKTLENNYGIQRSQNLIEIADNNQSLLNSGYLPSISANAGTTYNIENIDAEFQDGEPRVLNGAETKRYNASVNLNYTLFDGLGRFYNYKQLKTTQG